MPALADRLTRVANALELDGAGLARVLEANPRTVTRWLKSEAVPRAEARERLLEVITVLERLSATLQPAAAHDWLFAPNLALEYRKPVDLLRAGDYRTVLGAVDALAEGIFV